MKKKTEYSAAALVFVMIAGQALARAGSEPEDAPSLAVLTANTVSIDASARKAWKWSLAPLLASESLDAASSYGYRELNPVLAERNGEFGAQSAALKFAAVGVLIGTEYLLVRKFPRSARFFSKLNWSGAAVTTGLAVHNYAIH